MKELALDSLIAMKIFENVTDEFLKDNSLIFAGRSDNKNLHFSTVAKNLKAWKKSRNCISFGCENRSVKRSHTIQKSSSIQLLSEKGKVLTPVFDQVKGKVELKEIGVNDASAFPGFCEEHEKMFATYESNKMLTQAEDVRLQIYRTICREVIVKQFQIESLNRIKTAYSEFRNERLMNFIQKQYHAISLPGKPLKIEKYNLKTSDIMMQALDSKFKETSNDLKSFKSRFFDKIESDIRNNTSKMAYLVVTVTKPFPVALAGRANFIESNSRRNVSKCIEFVINILPFEKETKIILATPHPNKKALEYLISFYSRKYSLLKLIESWMVFCTDHWFIKPSYWNSLHPDIQQKITDLIPSDNKGKFSVPTFDIFDDSFLL